MSWTPGELGSVDKFQDMANNDQYLYDYTPRAYMSNTNTSGGILIVGGHEVFAPNKKHSVMRRRVNFKNLFVQNPIVTATPATLMGGLLSCVLRGHGQVVPGTDGFTIQLQHYTPKKSATDGITRRVVVQWIAMGPSQSI